MKPSRDIARLIEIMAALRDKETGCPWDLEQDFATIAPYTIEEAYEVADAIARNDMGDLCEELGDLLLQSVYHARLAEEAGAFAFPDVVEAITSKLIRRHPHVFGDAKVKDVEGVWTQWDKIKRAEKEGTRHARTSAFDGIPKHLPALLRAEKLVKKARKAGLASASKGTAAKRGLTRAAVARELFALSAYAQQHGWSAEALLRKETQKTERALRRQERAKG